MLRELLSRRWAALVTGLVGAVVLALLVTVAVVSPGFTAQRMRLDDGAVWVVNREAQAIGRANPAVLELNAVIGTDLAAPEILQRDGVVLVVDTAGAALDIVDPVDARVVERVALPPDIRDVLLVGDRVVIHSADGGGVWTVPIGEIDAYDPASPPVLSLGDGSVISAIPGDGLYALAPAFGELYRVETDRGSELVDSWPVDVDPAATGLQLSSVGDDWAVLDAAGGRVLLEAGTVSLAGLDPGSNVRIQQPGPAADSVLIAASQNLLAIPLGGGGPQSLVGEQAGLPAAPIVTEDCVFAAWSAGTAWRECQGAETRLALSSMPGSAQLAFVRGTHGIVLNDLSGGSSWAVADAGQLIDNWAQLTAPEEEQEEIVDEDAPPEIDPVQKPPVALDDEFGARPGRATVLPVLLNDYDPNGDVLVISEVGAVEESVGRVDLVARNQQLQLTLEPSARGIIEIPYTISDGRGGTASAVARIAVRGEGENGPPQQQRMSSMTVIEGGRMSMNLLGDWVDPDGDPLYLVSAATQLGQVSVKPDGTVVFADPGDGPTRATVVLTVSDGQEEATGTLQIERRPRDQVPIVVQPWVVLAAVGEELTVHPLQHVRAGGAAVRLGAVPEKPGTTVVPNFDSGTFVFSSDRVGTHYLSVTVTDGDRSGTGLVRVEVFAPPETGTRPITVPHTLFVRSLSSATLNPTAADIDPAGGVLVVTGVEDALAASGLRSEILDQRDIRVTLQRPLDDGPATLRYRISNGTADAEGVITVVELPAPTRVQPPLATDDAVTVRVGDVVDIPVLRNDEQPDGQSLSLDPELVEGLPPGGGFIFASGEQLRYLAPGTAGDYSVVYSALGEDGQSAQATVRIAVREVDAESNSAPLPRSVTARVIAGERVAIELPLSSIDPDGDAVRLVGIASTPEKGTVLSSADGSIEYRAGDYSSGTDSFRYVVVDGLGARAEGLVRVGISPRLEGARNPVANEDIVEIRPGRTASVRVLVNDSDPDGSPLRIVSARPSEEDGTQVEVEDDLLRITPPNESGRYSVVYTIENEFGGQSSAFVTLTVDPDAPLSTPVARDTVLTVGDVIDSRSIEVDILANVFFADGDVSELGLELIPGFGDDVRITAERRIAVEIGGPSQIIPFAVIHPEDPSVRAHAFVWVPGYDDALPQLDPAAPSLEVVSEETLIIELNEQVVALGSGSVRLVDAGTVSATHSDGSSLVVDEDTLRFTSAERYFGPAAITFEVTDGAGPDDPEGRRAVLTLPITVTPRENQPPVFVGAVVDFEPGQAREFDLIRLTNYPYDDIDELAYTVLEPLPSGFTIELNGQRLVITAGLSTPTGTSQVARVGVRDAINEGQPGLIRLSVVPSTRPLARPAPDEAVVRRGQTTTVDVLSNDEAGNPFPGSPLQVIAIRGLEGAALPAGVSITPDASGSRLEVTVAATAEPSDTTLQYQLADATGDPIRYVWGRVTISVQDVPDPVTAVQVTGFGDRSLRLTWSPGAANNSPISHYDVVLTGADGQTVSTTECVSTAGCTVPTPGNGPAHAVRIGVVAVNEIGGSRPTSASGPIWSDVIPPAPVGLSSAPIDRGLTVSWSKPEGGGAGSPIDRYLVTVAGQTQTLSVPVGDPAGTSYSLSIGGIAGVSNGTAVTYTVSARNGAPTSLASWNQASGSGIPAWTPLVVGSPSASGIASPTGTIVSASWNGAFGNNGRAITGYLVLIGAGPVGSCEAATPVGMSTAHEFTGLAPDQSYTVAVFAVNGLGGCSAPATTNVVTRATPGLVTAATIGEPEPNGTGRWDFRITGFSNEGGAATQLRYRLVGDGVDGSDSGIVPVGSFLTTGNGSHYGRSVAVEVRACAVWPEVTLCSPDWSAAFPVGTAVNNAPPPGLTATITDVTSDPITVTGEWSWNGPPTGSYDLIEYECGDGRQPMPAGPGQCEAFGEAEPSALIVWITQAGVEYQRSYSWADYD